MFYFTTALPADAPAATPAPPSNPSGPLLLEDATELLLESSGSPPDNLLLEG